MNKFKKLVLTLTIIVGMMITAVVGVMSFNNNVSPASTEVSANNMSTNMEGSSTNAPNSSKPFHQPETLTVKAGDIAVQKGGDSISYTYSPTANSKQSIEIEDGIVAYEYIFLNSMDRASAVNLKEIDTTDVMVYYAYHDSSLLESQGDEQIQIYSDFQCRKLEKSGEKLYVYIVVIPLNETIPTTFSASVVWYFGIPLEVPFNNNLTGETMYHTIVTGQSITKSTLHIPQMPEGYNFDSWYLDENFTIKIEEDEVEFGQKLYAKCWNLPENWISVNYSNNTCKIIKGTDPLPTGDSLIMPTTYEGYPVTETQDGDIQAALGSGDYSSLLLFNQAYTRIDLPSQLTRLGAGTLAGCYNIQTVELPDTLQEIGMGAFGMCSALTEITIPQSVQVIDSYAFAMCESLGKVSVERNSQLTSIVDAAFGQCSSLKSIELGNCSELTYIGSQAFAQCASLNDIDLTYCTNLETIGSQAFVYCMNLKEIHIPERVTAIPEYAFMNCMNLQTVNFAENSVLNSVGAQAFAMCMNLTTAFLPNSITTISNAAFSGCVSLVDFNLPSGITTIGASAFGRCMSLTSITLPTGLTSIGGYAFERCVSLVEIYDLSTSLTITAGDSGNGAVASMAKVVHTSSTNASRIKNSNGVMYYVYDDDYIAVTPRNKMSVTSVTLDKATTEINMYAFAYCISLTSLTIPQNVTTIGEQAFMLCNGLAEIYNLSPHLTITIGASNNGGVGLNARVVHTNSNAISRIKEKNNMLYYVYSTDYVALVPKNALTTMEVKLDANTTEINTGAFMTGMMLSYVDLSECSKLHTIGAGAFSGTSIPTIDLSACTSLETIGESAFEGCGSLSSVILPNSITTIEAYAFENCYSLTSLDLSNCTSLVTISESAFESCSSLSSVILPNSVTTIGANAFDSCSSLSSLDLSGCTGLVTISESAFESCSSLTSITLPNSITTIEANAFYSNSLSSLDLSNCTSLQVLGDYSFAYCSGLNSIILPSSLIEINEYAFNGCSNLTTVDLTLCENLEIINTRAFYGCTSLQTFTIPESVNKVAAYVFYESGLTSLTIASTVGWYMTTSSTDWEAMQGGEAVSSSILGSATDNATLIKGDMKTYYMYKIEIVTLNTNGGTFEGVSGTDEYEFASTGGTLTESYTLTNMGGYNFTLGSDGYYVSGNKGVNSSYSLAKISFTAEVGDVITFTVIQSSEYNYDYGMFSKLNTALTSSSTSTSTEVYKSFKGTSSTSAQTFTYTITTEGTNYVYVKYLKDGSAANGTDSFKIKSTISRASTVTDYTSATTTMKGKMLEVATPVRDGYTFVGWFTEAEGGTQVNVGTRLTADITLYAHWEEN